MAEAKTITKRQPREVEIMIFKGQKKEDKLPVVVRPNGKKHTIPRGVWTRVPVEVINALKDAVEDKLERVRPEERGEVAVPGQLDTIWIEVQIPRFNYHWRPVEEEPEEADLLIADLE